MRNTICAWGRIGVASLVMAMTGCVDSGPATYPVKGTVTFDGQPVADGQIIFYATETGVTPDAAPIKDGKYSLVAREGQKRVHIEATRVVPGKMIPRPAPATGEDPVTEMYIPESYNTKSTLEAFVTDSARDNEFDFTLKSDGSK